MSSKPSKLPAWGGGAGSRLASQAAAAKLRTVRDKSQARSASSTGFRSSAEEAASSSSGASWGFAASREPIEEECCPAATPAATPVKMVTPSKGEARAAAAGSVKALGDSFNQSEQAAGAAAPAAAATGLPSDARAALGELAGKLGAAARSGGVLPLAGPHSWEEAFLAGVAVGLQLPAAGRRRTALHPVLLGVVLVSALVVLAGSALLPAGCAQARPTTVYYT